MDRNQTLTFLLGLLPGIPTVFLALLGGVGGAAILDVWWRPRRDRRQAAVLLLSEIINNVQLCLLQAHARDKAPRNIPPDFHLNFRRWDAAAGKLAELPPDLVKNVMLLYMRFEALNATVRLYDDYLDRFKAAQSVDPAEAGQAERALMSTIDVFNTALDKTIDEGKKILAELLPLSGVKRGRSKEPVRDFARDVEEFTTERAARIEALLAMGERRGNSTEER